MTAAEFDAKYPAILQWIEGIRAAHTSCSRTVASLGFKRLQQYFPPEVLNFAKVVYVATVPAPPLTALGLAQFSNFEKMNAAGITYLDTFFSREEMREDEAHHFHELIHVIQWRLLRPKRFLAAYADGLERVGYRASPLELMAYTLESTFRNSQSPFDALYRIYE